MPTLAEWRSLFAVAGGRVGFEDTYRYWTGVAFGVTHFAKVINGTATMSGLYLHNPGYYRSTGSTGSIQVIGTEAKNPRYLSSNVSFSTGMVRCFKDCVGNCYQAYTPPTPPANCTPPKCAELTCDQKKNWEAMSEEQQLEALCPGAKDAGVSDYIFNGKPPRSRQCH